ncbi:MAG: hypothetical protein KAW56_03100 [Candidatus Marinimicrobia bacterium]|nr:hypothetical protein [Candidatus Neomarinimicrobiota bacterium]
MRDREKTKDQLVNELAELRQRIAYLETCESSLELNNINKIDLLSSLDKKSISTKI